MTVWILTLFPQMFTSVFAESIVKRAQKNKKVKIRLIDIRDFASDRHKTTDDKPYGGGQGMILKVNVVIDALESIKPKPYSILLAANGKKYTQKKAKVLSKKKSLALICGRYEGVDTRVEKFVDEVLSIGDYILAGGEIAAMAITESVIRMIPKVISGKSLTCESFSQDKLLEYPQYTRPNDFRSLKVPNILLSGDHNQIKKWRHKEALKRTIKLRPDLLQNS